MPYTLPAARRRPRDLGLVDGRLRACPNRPNCVSSLAAVEAQRVAPLEYQGDPAVARRRLLAILRADPRATVVTERDDYVHAEYRAFVFVDDVEFHLPAGEGVIHVRSASRLGHSDLGANARRVRAIRAAFSSPQ